MYMYKYVLSSAFHRIKSGHFMICIKVTCSYCVKALHIFTHSNKYLQSRGMACVQIDQEHHGMVLSILHSHYKHLLQFKLQTTIKVEALAKSKSKCAWCSAVQDPVFQN